MNLKSEKIIIFTDGSSRGNPGPGGFAAIIIAPQNRDLQQTTNNLQLIEIGGREEHTTNNRMEVTAAIKALETLKGLTLNLGKSRTLVYSDSSYLINGITKWIYGWQKNGWKTKTKQPVENQDLWEKLIIVTVDKKIDWKIIAGHVGVLGNERCDEIATAFADNLKPKLYNGSLERYPIKNILDIKIDESAKIKKSEDRNHSKAKAYSYVSMINGIIKTHKTWARCEARVKGKPARYKKALSPEEEKIIIKSFKAL